MAQTLWRFFRDLPSGFCLVVLSPRASRSILLQRNSPNWAVVLSKVHDQVIGFFFFLQKTWCEFHCVLRGGARSYTRQIERLQLPTRNQQLLRPGRLSSLSDGNRKYCAKCCEFPDIGAGCSPRIPSLLHQDASSGMNVFFIQKLLAASSSYTKIIPSPASSRRKTGKFISCFRFSIGASCGTSVRIAAARDYARLGALVSSAPQGDIGPCSTALSLAISRVITETWHAFEIMKSKAQEVLVLVSVTSTGGGQVGASPPYTMYRSH